MDPILISPIGIIHTPFRTTDGMPVQPSGAEGVKGYIELLPEFRDGLADLDGFSHIILVYQFHTIRSFKLKVKPFMDTREHGIFATRAPGRPKCPGHIHRPADRH